jgi:phytoene synthase
LTKSRSLAARLTRSSGTSFYYAFRVLPAAKRRAIYALYALCRALDDCVDEKGGEGEAGLRRWLQEVDRCYAGAPQTELGRELAEALRRFPIPRSCIEDVAEGCRMDLAGTRYSTFDELRLYCRRVAGAVGLASIEIFGYRDPGTRDYAVELGLALQLTNILRDLADDAARGRLYVPLCELQRFGVAPAEFLQAAGRAAPPPPAVAELLRAEAERARAHYERAQELLPAGDRRSMAPAEIMGAVYRALLDEFVRRGYPLGTRVRLSRPRKLWIALRTLARVRLAG